MSFLAVAVIGGLAIAGTALGMGAAGRGRANDLAHQANLLAEDNNREQTRILAEQLKFSTIYGAVNGGTSVSDDKRYSVTS